jgi:hypothetical protein
LRPRTSADWLEFDHSNKIYNVWGELIPTVKSYKYLRIMVNERLGDPRKVIVGERSMDLEYAHSQAKKGMAKLHVLRPFLTDRFCPIQLKVALVRNLVYTSMLYGAEMIGFHEEM